MGACSPKQVTDAPAAVSAGTQVAGAAASKVQFAQGRITGYCSSIDWLGKPPVIADKDIVQTIETDGIIIGGGLFIDDSCLTLSNSVLIYI